MVALGTVVAIIVGVVTGVFSAWKRGTRLDKVSTNIAIAFYSFPTQWLALVLLIITSRPGSRATGCSDDFLVNPTWLEHETDVLRHMALPSLTLALTLYGEYTLIVRSAMLETLGEDYVLTARAKGLSQRAIVIKHALRNATLPIITLIALSLGYIVAGAILIETVYSWPGIGNAVYQAVIERDYPMLQGAFLVLTRVGGVLQLLRRHPVLLAGPEDHGVADDPTTPSAKRPTTSSPISPAAAQLAPQGDRREHPGQGRPDRADRLRADLDLRAAGRALRPSHSRSGPCTRRPRRSTSSGSTTAASTCCRC